MCKTTLLIILSVAVLPSMAKQSFSASEWSVTVSTNEWNGDIKYTICGANHDAKETYKTLATAAFQFELTKPEVKDGKFFFDPICSLWFSYKGQKEDMLDFDIDIPMSRVNFDGGKPRGYAVKYECNFDSVKFYESEFLLRSVINAKQVDFTCYMLNKETKKNKKIVMGINPMGLPQAIHEAKLAFLKWGLKRKIKNNTK